jgi:hypothetical protein
MVPKKSGGSLAYSNIDFDGEFINLGEEVWGHEIYSGFQIKWQSGGSFGHSERNSPRCPSGKAAGEEPQKRL